MTVSDENTAIRDASETAVEYEGALENDIKGRPLTAVTVSVVMGALLAKFLF